MNNNATPKPSVVVRDFFQELMLGLPKGNMGAIDRHMTADVEMIVIGTTSPELVQVLPWVGKHVGREAVKDSSWICLDPTSRYSTSASTRSSSKTRRRR